MNLLLAEQFGFKLGANGLPYEFPLHPLLVHFTIGLFIVAIAFDVAGTLFPLEKPILRFLALPALRSSFYDVGWYNLLACTVVTFVTVAVGFFEITLANPPADETSDWGFSPAQTMLLHGLGGILILSLIVGMTAWRGLQRYRWRQHQVRQVQGLYLLMGIAIVAILYAQGTLGGQLGDEFGVHVTAAELIRQGKNPTLILK